MHPRGCRANRPKRCRGLGQQGLRGSGGKVPGCKHQRGARRERQMIAATHAVGRGQANCCGSRPRKGNCNATTGADWKAEKVRRGEGTGSCRLKRGRPKVAARSPRRGRQPNASHAARATIAPRRLARDQRAHARAQRPAVQAPAPEAARVRTADVQHESGKRTSAGHPAVRKTAAGRATCDKVRMHHTQLQVP